MSYRNDVDGLRAVAVLAVLIFHFKFGFISGGFTGVDIFFVISGFVIARALKIDLDEGRFSISNFYFKRIRRVFPALAVVGVATAIGSAFVLLPPDFEDFGTSLASASAFVSNIYFWKTSGYFAAAAETKPLLHTWSLSVEEQYYLFAPVLFALIHRWGRDLWLPILLPLIIAGFAASIATAFLAPTAGFFLIPSRLGELLLGAVLALRTRRIAAGPRLSAIFAWAGLLLIFWGLFAIEESDPFPGWNSLIPCLGTALIIEAGMAEMEPSRRPLVNRMLATRPFVGIGRISYSLYLVHWPLIALLHYRILRDPSFLEAGALTGVALLLAWASWKWVEQPFRHIGFARKRAVLTAGVGVIGIGAVLGGAIAMSHGLPQRFPDFVERRIPGVEAWGGNACFNQNAVDPTPWNKDTCRRITGSNGRILLWGDSFAAHYMPGILAASDRINADLYQYTSAGCPPIFAYYSIARRGCSQRNAAVPSIIDELHIDTVVMSGRWSDAPKATLARLHETVDTLLSRGVRVFVIGQSPQFPVDVQRLDYLSGRSAITGEVGTASVPLSKAVRQVEVEARHATWIDPMSRLCREDVCTYRNGSDFLYADYGHFSKDGSIRAVNAYFPVGVKP